jgi:hypothetical protein
MTVSQNIYEGRAFSQLPKKASPNFDWLYNDFGVVQRGVGKFGLSRGSFDFFNRKFVGLFNGATTFVAPNGSNANDGLVPFRAFAQPDKAIRETVCGDVIIMPGEYDLPRDIRQTDTGINNGGAVYPKRIIAPFGGVVFRIAGDDIAALNYLRDVAHIRTWASLIATNNNIVGVYDKRYKDEYGNYIPFPKASTAAILDGSGFGWHFDDVTRRFKIAYPSDTDFNAIKANFFAVYGDPAGQNGNRFYMQGTKLYFENIEFRSFLFVASSGAYQPTLVLNKCKVLGSTNQGIQTFGGDYIISENSDICYTTGDCANYEMDAGNNRPKWLEINNRQYGSGNWRAYGKDLASNPLGQLFNFQPSTNHNGHGAAINGIYDQSLGQTRADTGGETMVFGGEYLDNYNPAASGLNFGVESQNQKMTIDKAIVRRGVGDGAAILADGASGSVKYFGTEKPTISNGAKVSLFDPVYP